VPPVPALSPSRPHAPSTPRRAGAAFAVAVCLGTLCLTTGALAKGKEALPPEVAKADRAEKKGDWNGARTALLAAYEKKKIPLLAFRLAQVDEKVGALGQAFAHYDDVLQGEVPTGPDGKPDPEAVALRDKARTAQFRLQATGAKLRLVARTAGPTPKPASERFSMVVDGHRYVLHDGDAIVVDPGLRTVKIYGPDEVLIQGDDISIANGDDHPVKITVAAPKVVEAPPPPAPKAGMPTGKILGYSALGLGAAGLGTGIVFGVLSKGTRNDLSNVCVANQCPESARSTYSKGTTQATVSTIAFVAGGLFAATGALLLVTSSSSANEARPAPRAGHVHPYVTPNSVGFQGAF
jgi:hypothetical protein